MTCPDLGQDIYKVGCPFIFSDDLPTVSILYKNGNRILNKGLCQAEDLGCVSHDGIDDLPSLAKDLQKVGCIY